MLFATAGEAASNGEEQTQTSPENGPQITRSRTIEVCSLEQSHVFEFKALVRPCIREFIDWYCSEPRLAFNRTVVTRYRIALEQHPYAPSTINLRLAAIRRLAYEASDCGLLSPDLAAGIRRMKGVRRLGVRVGNWLTADEGKKFLGAETAYTLRSRRTSLCSRFSSAAAYGELRLQPYG
jgi:hypothetical protein